jgi:hypothetical protein
MCRKSPYYHFQATAFPGRESGRRIAEHVGVDEGTVRKYRRELEASSEIRKTPTRTVTRNGKTYTQDTSNFGRKPAAEARERQSSVKPLERSLASADQ